VQLKKKELNENKEKDSKIMFFLQQAVAYKCERCVRYIKGGVLRK